MIISFTGFMGCGKSSVGRELSELLCCRFTDLDALIEEQAGCSIPEIFERSGEKEFRRMEAEALRGLSEDMGYLGQKNSSALFRRQNTGGISRRTLLENPR